MTQHTNHFLAGLDAVLTDTDIAFLLIRIIDEEMRLLFAFLNLNTDDVTVVDIENGNQMLNRRIAQIFGSIGYVTQLGFLTHHAYDTFIVVNAEENYASASVRKGDHLLSYFFTGRYAALELSRESFALIDPLCHFVKAHGSVYLIIVCSIKKILFAHNTDIRPLCIGVAYMNRELQTIADDGSDAPVLYHSWCRFNSSFGL